MKHIKDLHISLHDHISITTLQFTIRNWFGSFKALFAAYIWPNHVVYRHHTNISLPYSYLTIHNNVSSYKQLTRHHTLDVWQENSLIYCIFKFHHAPICTYIIHPWKQRYQRLIDLLAPVWTNYPRWECWITVDAGDKYMSHQHHFFRDAFGNMGILCKEKTHEDLCDKTCIMGRDK